MSAKVDLITKTGASTPNTERDKRMITAVILDTELKGTISIQTYNKEIGSNAKRKNASEIHIFADDELLFKGTLRELRYRLKQVDLKPGLICEDVLVTLGETYYPITNGI